MIADIEAFLAKPGLCFDVRSPKEYLHAKIPGALSLPLFSDEERALVGTSYKRQGKEVAIRLGVEIVGPKLSPMLASVDTSNTKKEPIGVYCWRGGMRSGFISYFLNFTGHATTQLNGGYKAFRRYVLAHLDKPRNLAVIGGLTGSGKTEILHALKRLGHSIVDLEQIARHRGSVYGELAGQNQPSNEQFENELASQIMPLPEQNLLWIEDESRLIGHCQIPNSFYEAKKRAPLFIVQATKDERVARILAMYANFSPKQWSDATIKIQKRLGSAKTQAVLQLIQQGQLADAISLLLDYYDQAYEYSISRHLGPILRFSERGLSAGDWATLLQNTINGR